MERIEQETEVHRLQKAIKYKLGEKDAANDILFPQSRVMIHVAPSILHTRGGQQCLALMVNLLARMKTAVSDVVIDIPHGVSVRENVPLVSNDLRDSLGQLAEAVNGPESRYTVRFEFERQMVDPTVTVSIGRTKVGHDSPDICVEANAWTAFVNTSHPRADWDTQLPFGAHIAATLAVAEIFKLLLLRNFPDKAEQLRIRLLDNAEFSGLTYGLEPRANEVPQFSGALCLHDVAIAGVGAGGSAALYTLGCVPTLTGSVTLIDPGAHKKSNLARYLLSSYSDCHTAVPKVNVACEFLKGLQPAVELHTEALPYDQVVDRDFRLVVSTVDSPEARWDIQNDWPTVILDAAVVETIYAALRVCPGKGMCLGCKHPYDPEITRKRRAVIWGKSFEQVLQLELERTPVTQADIERLARVQGQPVERYTSLLGMPFDEIPSVTECGDTRFDLREPNQAASIPFVTTMAGVLIACEVVKDHIASDFVLNNWFDHDMFWVPKPTRYRFRDSKPSCHICSHL